MTAQRPAELGGEVQVYIDRILVLAQQRAAQIVADASHEAGRYVAQARIEVPAVWGERNAACQRMLADVMETAAEAFEEGRARVGAGLESFERWQVAQLHQLDRKLDEMVDAFVAGDLGSVSTPVVRAPVERATDESAPFAQLRRLLDSDGGAEG